MNILWTHVLRGAQALLAALVLALAIASAATFFVPGFYPSQSAFLAFSGAWTLLAVLYFFLAPRLAPVIAGVMVRLGVEAVTCIFWFAGFIALAVAVSAVAPVEGDVPGTNPIDGEEGLNTMPAVMWFQISAAAAAFGSVEWLLFVVSTTLTAIEFYHGRKKSSSPAMAENPGDVPVQEEVTSLG